MRFSALQKYILVECYRSNAYRFDRSMLLDFYRLDSKVKETLRTKIITGSIESLIDKELMVGYGVRTPHKWYIRDIALTDKGKKFTKKMLDKQMTLPLKNKKKIDIV